MDNIRSFDKLVFCGQSGAGKTNLERYLLPSYERVLVFDPDDEFIEYPDISELKKGQSVNHARYLPRSDDPAELDDVARFVWNKGNTLLVVSEAEIYLPVHRGLLPWMFKLINRGRRRNIGCLVDTRRVANLNKTVFGLAEWVFIFRHFSPTDLKYLREFVPADVSKLRDLPDYHFWVSHRGIVEVHNPVTSVSY